MLPRLNDSPFLSPAERLVRRKRKGIVVQLMLNSQPQERNVLLLVAAGKESQALVKNRNGEPLFLSLFAV